MMRTDTYRCMATSACTVEATVTVHSDGKGSDTEAQLLLLQSQGWGHGLHGPVCPQHRPGELWGS